MMQRLYNVASSARESLLCQSGRKNNTHRRAAKMDPIVRSALATTIQEETCTNELEEISSELEAAKLALRQAEKKETFLGMRSYRYRKLLDQQAYELKEERTKLDQYTYQHDDDENLDEEAVASYRQQLKDWDERMEKWEKDEDALKSIQVTHMGIMANCEQMRRTVRELEKKKARLQKMNDQCQEFIDLAEEQKETEGSELAPLAQTTDTLERGDATLFGSDEEVGSAPDVLPEDREDEKNAANSAAIDWHEEEATPNNEEALLTPSPLENFRS
jgi:chromosome segregation ATPase